MESTQVDQKFDALQTISSELLGIIQHLEGTIHPKILDKLQSMKELAYTTIKPELDVQNKAWETNWEALRKIQEDNRFMTCWSMTSVKASDLEANTPKIKTLIYESWGETQTHEFESLTTMTWLEFWKLANDMIKKSGDDHHIFIESLIPVKGKSGTFKIITGS